MYLRLLGLALALPLAGCLSASGAIESTEATSSADTVDTGRHLRANVTGLLGGGLVLEDPVAGTVSAGGDGVVIFPNALPTGGTYRLTITDQPIGPDQKCTITDGSGEVGETDPVVEITCAAPTFTVGGHASGIGAVGLVLALNDEAIALSTDGTFRFETKLALGASYAVTVAQQPTGQTCRTYFASGTISSKSIDDVEVVCEGEPVALAE